MPRVKAAITLTALAAAAAGCSSGPARVTAAQAAHQRAVQTGRALGITRSQPATASAVDELTLGVLAAPADATGLAVARLGYIAVKLSPSGTRLIIKSYTSSAAEGGALADGKIDAGYVTPVAAVTAWQHTGHGIRIIAGATQTAGGIPSVVLAIRADYLASHPGQTADLLQGHVQATILLTTRPAVGLPAAAAELQVLTGKKITKVAVFGRYRSTNDPGQSYIRAKISAPAPELFELTSIDTLLRTSGLAPAS